MFIYFLRIPLPLNGTAQGLAIHRMWIQRRLKWHKLKIAKRSELLALGLRWARCMSGRIRDIAILQTKLRDSQLPTKGCKHSRLPQWVPASTRVVATGNRTQINFLVRAALTLFSICSFKADPTIMRMSFRIINKYQKLRKSSLSWTDRSRW